ncbi:MULTISPECIES: hypothetical protein [unclassified Pseudomonas]|uniref:hypothetical protein n=1 Tax=unclassified Pseudomonas TaxID=196821 RepID=UPI000D3CD9BF|nr:MULTISPECIES: hypothetical protein [unclassified Pseudomonas]RAU44657.1 hypothetical protein DBP26_016525 [Pseudomonas sp. RIT 409]RAU54907.1 hypothetical protein DBY65_007235 [Pseudomonas sp. RIT 412]
MHLYYTHNLNGILSDEIELYSASDRGCRTAVHHGLMYCTYLDEELGNVKVISKRGALGWDFVDGVDAVSSIVPALVSHNDGLYLIYANNKQHMKVCRYNEVSKRFVAVPRLFGDLSETPTFAALNGVMHMFCTVPDSENIFRKSSSDMMEWTRSSIVPTGSDGPAMTHLSPVAITYQNMIHLFYRDRRDRRFWMMKYDGFKWSRRVLLIDQAYEHSPGITIHNGLLKLIFAGNTGALELYGYDGNAISPPALSHSLTCSTASPSAASHNGELNVVFSR